MTTKANLNLKANLTDKFVAFLDVMGFSNLVKGNNTEILESYFDKITEILDALKIEKATIESFLISDSIILIAPDGLSGFKNLLIAIRRIQSVILWRKIFLRGAVSYGPVYYNGEKNIIVGKGFIKAYLLEQEAIFPRVIIDPFIIKKISTDRVGFITLINRTQDYSFEDRHVYTRSPFSKISDDSIFIDYANKLVRRKSLEGNLQKVYESIVENLYSDQKLYSKYVWLRDYFLEILQLTESMLIGQSEETVRHKKALHKWVQKFERL